MADAARRLGDEEDAVDDEAEDEAVRRVAIFERCDCVIDLVAILYNISGKEMRECGRGSIDVTRGRQIAMYVAHTVLELSMREVGIGFGRDRTTVLYAVHLIEDLREDREFDAMLARTELIAKTAMRGRKVWSLRG